MEIRPSVVAEVARWWQQSLSAAEQQGAALIPANVNEVAVRFQCSEEEALRGLAAGEQLHWSGDQ